MRHHSLFPLCLIIVLASLCPRLYSEDVMTIESHITASQEQPKILVIIPWQKPQNAETIDDNILNAKENFFLKPLDRKPFQRYTHHLNVLLNPEKP